MWCLRSFLQEMKLVVFSTCQPLQKQNSYHIGFVEDSYQIWLIANLVVDEI